MWTLGLTLYLIGAYATWVWCLHRIGERETTGFRWMMIGMGLIPAAFWPGWVAMMLWLNYAQRKYDAKLSQAVETSRPL